MYTKCHIVTKELHYYPYPIYIIGGDIRVQSSPAVITASYHSQTTPGRCLRFFCGL